MFDISEAEKQGERERKKERDSQAYITYFERND